MPRRIVAVAAGFLAFEGAVLLLLLAARTLWPAYAAAEPTRDYAFAMLLARLAAGASAVIAGGAVAARIDRPAGQAATFFGIALLLLSAGWHIHIWRHYPVWYHLAWLACIVPAAVLGGRTAARSERSR